jgi:uncharacterized protein
MINLRKLLPILLVLLMLLVPVVTIAGAVEYPVLTEHITDNAGIINAEYRQKLGDLLNHIEQNTTAEVAILTIKSLEGVDKAEYATEVGQKSGIGKKDTDNGLLLLIAMDDGQGSGKGAYFVATGYGLEGTLPDATVTQINNEVLIPFLKKGKETGDISYYGQGIYEEMSVFEGLLTNNSEIVSKYGSSSSSSSGSGGDVGVLGAIIIGIIIIFVIVVALAFLTGSGGGGSGGYSSGGYSSGGSNSGGSSGESGGGFGGGGFGGGGSGGSFKRATGTAATSSHSSSSSSSSHRSSSYNSGFGGGGFRSGGSFGGGRFGGGGSGGSW